MTDSNWLIRSFYLTFGLISLLFSSQVAQAQASFADDELLYGGAATTVQWGDLDGDGLKDMFIAEGGKHSSGNSVLSWFKAPTSAGQPWVEYAIGADLTRFTGDSDVVDIDRDGHLDIVLPRDDHASLNPPGTMQWYKNPGNLATTPAQNWTKYIIESPVPDAFHQGDLETADVDGDNKLDIIVRSLGTNRFVIYFQNTATDWHAVRINSPHPREGLVVGNLDGNGKVDIIGNGFILFAPDNPRACTVDGQGRCMASICDVNQPASCGANDWKEKAFDANYYNSSTGGSLKNSSKGEVFDMDGDGRLDILQSAAEGNDVYLAWYKNPSNAQTGNWARTLIESPQGKNHNVQVGDVDLDGDVDVLGGFSFGAKKVVWWENTNGLATAWTRHQIDGSNGCYSCVAADYDGDGDIDFAGPTRYANKVYLYRNTTADGSVVLSINPGAMNFTAAGGSQNLAITSRRISDNSGVAWTATSNQAWLTVSVASGPGNANITISASAHTGFGNRSAVVSISNGSITRNLNVSQAGASDTVAPSVPQNVSASNISYDSFSLDWSDSSDNSGQVSEYIIYANLAEVARSASSQASITGLTDSTAYSVRVSAIDPSGNESAQSGAVAIITTARPPSPPPIAHWKFDETSGSTASDSSVNNSDGSLSASLGANQWDNQNQRLGTSALRFDGGNDMVSIGNLDSGASAITIVTWVKPGNINGNDGKAEGRIISKATGTSEQDHYWMISTDKNSANVVVPRLRLRVNNSTQTILGESSGVVANDVWSQIIATYDGSLIKVFHNGSQVASVSASGAVAQSNSVPAVIGNTPGGGKGFEGLIDDVCLFDYAISTEDVSYLYNAGGGRACDTLISGSNPDVTAPVIAEVTPVPTPGTERSPGYVYATNEAGVATFGGSCFVGRDPVDVPSGEIILSIDNLNYGTYNNCTIVVTDAAGNSSNTLNLTPFIIVEPDTTRPTVTLNQAADQADPTISNLVRFVLTFSEPINRSTLSASDISLSGTSGIITVGPNPVPGSNNSQFLFSVTGMNSGDQVVAALPANSVADLSANLNEVSTSSDNQVLYECNGCGLVDQDQDGITDNEDNCPAIANADQTDANNDGIGDACADDSICFSIVVKNGNAVLICL